MLLQGTDCTSGKEPTKTRKLFDEILKYFTETYAKAFGITEGPPMHDPVAVFAAMNPDAFHGSEGDFYAVLVDSFTGYTVPSRRTAGCGKTVLRRLREHELGIKIPTSFDIDIFWKQIETSLSIADFKLKGKRNP